MSYYPKSQITPNLFTNGDEFVYLHNENISYTGFYYKTSAGKFYTGKNPSNGNGSELISRSHNPLITSLDDAIGPPETKNLSPGDNVINLVELDLEGDDTLSNYNSDIIYSYPPVSDFQRRSLPTPYYPKPTSKEIEIGEYRRYFAKKTNEPIYIEISKNTYNKLKTFDPSIAFDLYECLDFPWSLMENSEVVNKRMASIIERDNNWYGFSTLSQLYSIKIITSTPSNGGNLSEGSSSPREGSGY